MLRIIVSACLLLLVGGEQRVEFVNNTYARVVVAIDNSVPEDDTLVDAIKEMMKEASEVMYRATGGRAYFKEVTILVPKTWDEGKYFSAVDETYNAADIRISPPRHQLGNNPYTYGYGVQRTRGLYIHFTPEYVKDDITSVPYGPRGNVVVHEWSHYRWGLKDGYPAGGAKQERSSTTTESSNNTRCTLVVSGSHSRTDFRCPGWGIFDTQTPSPWGCNFQTTARRPKDLSSALDNTEYGDEIEKLVIFCHDEAPDTAVAPNVTSIQPWQTILNSATFKNSEIDVKPTGLVASTTEPVFRLVKAVQKRVVLVLDTSGSMNGTKLTNVKRVAETFVKRLIGDGTYVGLVQFSWKAITLSPLIKVDQDSSSRDYLANALDPAIAYGNTAIGAGIKEGLDILEKKGPSGGQLIVLTDGQETASPYVANVTDLVLTKEVVVNSIFFGLKDVTANAPLVELTELSGGKWFYSRDTPDSISQLTSIFAALAQPDDGDLSSTSVQIFSSVAEMKGKDEISSSVALDGSVGKQTAFSFTWSENQFIVVKLKQPNSSCIYSNVDNLKAADCGMMPVTNHDSRTITFNIPGTAKAGVWEYSISSVYAGAVSVTVTSAPSVEGVYPITLETEQTLSNVSGNEAAVIVAAVMQNTMPVLGATVTAKITRPVGDPITLDLIDNGAGADETKNDGIYARYFSQFNAHGRYSIQVTVFKNGSEPAGIASLPKALLESGEVLDDGTFLRFDNINISKKISGAEINGSLQRIATTTGLAYTGIVPTSDIFPPNKITDLSVTQVDRNNSDAGIRLKFTAPGDDYDFGKATRYDIRYSNGTSTTLLSNFGAQLSVKSTSVKDPKPALSEEEFVVMLPHLSSNTSVIRISVAIQSFDEMDNPSEVSNAVTLEWVLELPTPTVSTSSARSSFRVSMWLLMGAVMCLLCSSTTG